MAAAPEGIRAAIQKRSVKVKAHTRKVAPKPDAGAVASGQRYAALGSAIAKKNYTNKTVIQRKASVKAAHQAGPDRTRAQRVILATHGERASVAGQARSALAKRYDSPEAGKQLAAHGSQGKKVAPVDAESIMKSRLATAGVDAAALRASLKGVKGPDFLNRAAKNTVAFTMEQLVRPSAAIGSEALNRIEHPQSIGQPGGENGLKEGFLHPEEHASDWNKVVEHAGVHNKYVKGGLALSAAIATDPTTYLTFGTSTLAKEAGARAAARTMAAGGKRADAIRAGRAAADTLGEAGEKTGVKVGVRGAPVRAATKGRKRELMTKPLGAKTRLRVGDAARKVTQRSGPSTLPSEIREGARKIVGNPNVKPRGWGSYEYDVARQAGNTGRAMERAAQHDAKVAAHTYTKATKGWDEDRHLKVLTAVESKNLDGLDDAERAVATGIMGKGKLYYGTEPGRPELAEDARVGFAQRPEPPVFDEPIQPEHLKVSAYRAQEAREKLQATLDAPAVFGREPNTMDMAMTAAARENVRHAARAHDALKSVAARQRKAVKEYERASAAYETAPQGYAPRVLKPGQIEPIAVARHDASRGPKIGNSVSYKGRSAVKSLAHMDPEELAKYETNIPALMSARALEHGRITAAQEQHEWMAGLGDVVQFSPAQAKQLTGNKTMKLFARDEFGVHPLYNTQTGEVDVAKLTKAIKDGDEVSSIHPDKLATIEALVRGGRSTSLPDVADLLRKAPGEQQEHFLRRVHRTWKWWATAPNPSYHARNAVGDTFNALTAGTTMGDFKKAFALNRVNSALGVVERELGTPAGKRAIETLRKAAGKSEHYDGVGGELSDLEIMSLANKYGAINSGIVSGELRDFQLAGEGPVVKALHLGPARDTIQKASDYRENFARLATFRNGLKRGLTPPEAAQYSLRHHIDYSNLSQAEQGFWRYAIPFWTWWSRNLPLQATKVATRPGLYANTEKARQQSLIAAGVDPNVAMAEGESDQENLPWGIPDAAGKLMGGGPNKVTAGPGLPYGDLGSVPLPHGDIATTLKPVAQDVISRTSPLAKLLFEQGTGLNSFTLTPHEQYGQGKYVPKPAFIPDWVPGVKTKYNKKTGKMEKQINWRVLNVINTAPVASRAGKVAPTGADEPGKATAAMARASWLTGPRFMPVDPGQIKLNQLYDKQADINSWITEHSGDVPHQTGVPWSKTPHGQKMAKKLKERAAINKEMQAVRKSMGFKNIKPPGRPKSTTSHTFGTSGGSSGMFGAGGK